MASGHFLIGDGISYELFREYVLPQLNQKGCNVPDSVGVQVTPEQDPGKTVIFHDQSVLASVVGEGDLEAAVSEALIAAADSMQAFYKEKHIPESSWQAKRTQFTDTGWETPKEGEGEQQTEIGRYVLVGTYSRDEAASESFSGIASKYFADATKKTVEEIAQRLAAIGAKLSR